jgi:hypothetical protein
MLVRDVNGQINIISRKDCKDDRDYYQKLVKIRLEYAKKYKSIIIVNLSKELLKNS